jgi:hypothetical protein
MEVLLIIVASTDFHFRPLTSKTGKATQGEIHLVINYGTGMFPLKHQK